MEMKEHLLASDAKLVKVEEKFVKLEEKVDNAVLKLETQNQLLKDLIGKLSNK
jgi:hypothetical protein